MSQPLDTQIAQDAYPVDKPRVTFYQLLQMDARGLWAAVLTDRTLTKTKEVGS